MKNLLTEYLKPNSKNMALIYIMYLCSVVVPLLAIFAMIILYLNRKYYDDSCRTHYVFLLRTFVIKFLIAFIITIFSAIPPINILGFLFNLLTSIWFICRAAFGFKYLVTEKEHPNPLTLWID
ncbi:MAG: hypothetical protein EOP33_01525 [Rickettsiaceae bacterium]|nr:MAG: hypothetical protein EOP33_01525 [Rickettsiaceae bacterium]